MDTASLFTRGSGRLKSVQLLVIVNVTALVMARFQLCRATGSSAKLISQADQEPQQQSAHNRTATSVEASALNYLQRYGYMSAQPNGLSTNQLVSEDSFSAAISSFQRFAGLPETGQADELTLHQMQLPRCGNKDQPMTGNRGRLARALQFGRRSQQVRSGKQLASGSLRRRRRKRYALQGSKWRRQELSYRISQYPSRFSGKRQEVDSQIERAFRLWSQVAPIDFVPKREGRVHIDIRFASGDHGDGDAFDGPGNTLAHAYFPQYGGNAHFDDQELWTIDSYTGTNIFQVAAHELGHSLGLGHSNVREALMAPFYQKYKPNFRLHLDDVLAIQALYGEKPYSVESLAGWTGSPAHASGSTPSSAAPGSAPATSSPAPSSSPPPAPEEISPGPNSAATPGAAEEPAESGAPAGWPELEGTPPSSSSGPSEPSQLCSEPRIDAITRTADGSTYVFKGDLYWLLEREGPAKGYPRPIGPDWDGLPGKLDAALTWADGKTFFFKGNKYWRFRNRRRDVGYPKLISAGFAGIPDNIDAAFVWSGNGRTYIFKGNQYWRFDSKAEPPVSAEYPRPVRAWTGVPAHIDAAFKWDNNVTYFFKGNQYWRFNDRQFRVEPNGRPPFPRPTADWWFGCNSANLAAQRAAAHEENMNEESPAPEATAPVAPLEAAQTADPTDWSFFANQPPATRIPGTHISDQTHQLGRRAPHSSAISSQPSYGAQSTCLPAVLLLLLQMALMRPH